MTHRRLAAIIFVNVLAWTKPPLSHALSSPIIADHTSVQAFDFIPPYWLDQAKKLTLHYAHTSHGSQIISGIDKLEHLKPVYSFAHRQSGTDATLPPVENPYALRIYDGNPPETYIEPGDYWESSEGVNRTKAVVATNSFSASMWSWCGQLSYYPQTSVQHYLNTISQLERDYPHVNFIYMTGHTDGTQDNPDSPLKINNQLIRDYARANNKVLFDFADIESYDPSGKYYPNTSDGCAWCSQWCATHPQDYDCQNPPASCAHSHPLNCALKAKAFWWLMARMAGWDGTTSTTPKPTTPVTLVPSPSLYPGDYNQDTKVDFLDYRLLKSRFNTSHCDELSTDCQVNVFKINHWFSAFLSFIRK